MTIPVFHEEIIQQQFDSFCKKILRDETRDYLRMVRRCASREISLDNLSDAQISTLQKADEYPSDFTSFQVQGKEISIRDDRLASAIASLSPEKQAIVLLSFFLDMTDREIAESLNLVRSSVQYKRARSLEEIKKRMEE